MDSSLESMTNRKSAKYEVQCFSRPYSTNRSTVPTNCTTVTAPHSRAMEFAAPPTVAAATPSPADAAAADALIVAIASAAAWEAKTLSQVQQHLIARLARHKASALEATDEYLRTELGAQIESLERDLGKVTFALHERAALAGASPARSCAGAAALAGKRSSTPSPLGKPSPAASPPSEAGTARPLPPQADPRASGGFGSGGVASASKPPRSGKPPAAPKPAATRAKPAAVALPPPVHGTDARPFSPTGVAVAFGSISPIKTPQETSYDRLLGKIMAGPSPAAAKAPAAAPTAKAPAGQQSPPLQRALDFGSLEAAAPRSRAAAPARVQAKKQSSNRVGLDDSFKAARSTEIQQLASPRPSPLTGGGGKRPVSTVIRELWPGWVEEFHLNTGPGNERKAKSSQPLPAARAAEASGGLGALWVWGAEAPDREAEV